MVNEDPPALYINKCTELDLNKGIVHLGQIQNKNNQNNGSSSHSRIRSLCACHGGSLLCSQGQNLSHTQIFSTLGNMR